MSNASAARTVDYGLMLSRIQHLALTGEDTSTLRQLLAQHDALNVLDAQSLLQWATWAQVAQDSDAAQAAWEALHRRFPHIEEGWRAHRDFLAIIGDRAGIMRLRALCSQLAPDMLHLFCPAALSGGEAQAPTPSPPEPASPDIPFMRQARQERLIQTFARIFQGREDCFARQWADKAEGKTGYVPVRQPMTTKDILDHIQGRRTYGIYLLQADGRTRLGVIDADLRKELRSPHLPAATKNTLRRELAYLLSRLPEVAQEAGLQSIVEFSGSKGYHFWFPFGEPVDPAAVRSALGRITARIQPDLSCFHLEVFPKQDSLSGKGLGNLVKLPLGIHRMSGKPSRLLPGNQPDVWAQLERLASFTPNPPQTLGTVPPAAAPIEHPTVAVWRARFPDLAELVGHCRLLAGIVALCQTGRSLSLREERVLLGTVGFLPGRQEILHALLGGQEGYNPHLVDYKISRLRGSPLGCRKIHALLESPQDFCPDPGGSSYLHPLVFVRSWQEGGVDTSERIQSLEGALRDLRRSMDLVERFLPRR